MRVESPTQAAELAPTPAPRLLDRLREAIRVRHYSIRTEDTYVDWARRCIRFHDKRHPVDLGPSHVEALLTHLAVERCVSPSTQNQAKSALLFLYRVVLEIQLPWLDEVVAAKDQRRLPVVPTPSEVRALLHELSGTMGLVASLLYGTGCACWRLCGCASRTSISIGARSSCGMARAARTVSRCCRRT
jgi:integrase